jgi:hypothetical protein
LTDNEVKAIDENDRCAEADDDDCLLDRIEINFAIPIYLSHSQQRRMHELIHEIVRDHKNQPKEGVHWLSMTGSKPNFSAVDCNLLGLKPGPNPPADGEEPNYDALVLCFGSSARSFNSERERAREIERRRKSEFTCPQCGGHTYGSNVADVTAEGKGRQWVRYCNGRGQRGKFIDGKFVPIEGPQEPTIRCDFTWPESDDLKYGLKPPNQEESTGMQVPE